MLLQLTFLLGLLPTLKNSSMKSQTHCEQSLHTCLDAVRYDRDNRLSTVCFCLHGRVDLRVCKVFCAFHFYIRTLCRVLTLQVDSCTPVASRADSRDCR